MQISKKCFSVLGLSTISPWVVNAGFIVGDKKTLIIDTGGNWLAAQTIYGYAKLANPQNKIIVINSEPHFDHTGGNSFFAEKGIDIMGHYKINRPLDQMPLIIDDYNSSIFSKVRRDAKEAEIFFMNTKVVNPNIKIENEMVLDLGNLTVEILFTPGHTDKNISIYVENDDVLYSGDTIVQGYIPNLEEGGPVEWQNWLTSINRIINLAPKIIVPGHGKILKSESIDFEINRVKAILETAIKTGTAPTKN